MAAVVMMTPVVWLEVVGESPWEGRIVFTTSWSTSLLIFSSTNEEFKGLLNFGWTDASGSL